MIRRLSDLSFLAFVGVTLVTLLFPFYWVVNTSLKAPGELFRKLDDGELPAFVPASFWLESAVLSVQTASAAAQETRRRANETLDSAQGAIDHYSVSLDATGQGEVQVTYDRRQTSLSSVADRLAATGLAVRVLSPPEAWPVFTNYHRVFTQNPFARYLLNSALVAAITTAICLLLGSACAYALARLRFPFRDAILSLVLAVSMFPPIAVVSPLFLMLKRLHLLNTYAALVIPYTVFGLPLTIWTLTSFFRELPTDLEEAARVDGCSRLRTFVDIFLPLAAPGVFTCAILVFIFAWNEFMFALLFVTRDAMRTVTVGITLYPGQYETPWGTIFAAATLVTLPLIIVVFILQRRIIAGLTAGAVKG